MHASKRQLELRIRQVFGVALKILPTAPHQEIAVFFFLNQMILKHNSEPAAHARTKGQVVSKPSFETRIWNTVSVQKYQKANAPIVKFSPTWLFINS